MIGSDKAADRLAGELPAALKNGEVRVVFLPLVRLWDQAPVSLEALLRWQHPVFGQVSGERIMALAGTTPLVDEIAPLVLAAAGRLLGSLPPTVKVSLNACLAEILSPAFLSEIEAFVRRRYLKPGRLLVEIDAATLGRDADRIAVFCDRLAALGVGKVVEHLRLADLPSCLATGASFAGVKIDPYLVGRIGADRHAEAEIGEIVAQAGAAGLMVSAVRVETEPQAAFLMACGCQFAQGWLFGPPRPDGHQPAMGPVH